VSLTPPLFYFGAMSPYSWIAAERIDQLLPHARWRGVLAGVIFKEHGRTSWGLTEERAAGIAECEARAAKYGLGPIRWPLQWPTSDLTVGRAMAFLDRSTPSAMTLPLSGGAAAEAEADQQVLKRFALAAMRLAFLEGADLSELDTVLEAGRRSGIEDAQMREALAAKAVKDALRAVNEEALSHDVFGVPTVLVADQLFWGDDRLEDAAAAARSTTTA
jgi:2-hydroxychromene-2-carboxylate isomerase